MMETIVYLMVWTSFLVSPANCNEEQGNCLRFRMDNSPTARQMQAYFCAMSTPPEVADGLDRTLKCMEDYGIHVTDDDMRDFILLLPYEECVEDIVKTNDMYDDGEASLTTNIKDKAIENITDAILCADVLDTDGKPVKDGYCVVLLEGYTDIANIRHKQNRGLKLNETDRNILREHYFEHCSPEYKERYYQNTVTVNMKLVSAPNECKSTVVMAFEALKQVQRYNKIFAVIGFTVIAIGLLGAILSLAVFCRPSFLARHHVGYLCIGWSILDIFMLVYCAQSGFGQFLKDDHSGSYRESMLGIVRCGMFFVFFMVPEIGIALFTMALSIQRLFSVAFPLKAKVYLNKTVSKRICIAVVCISLAIPVICFVSLFAVSDFNLSCVLMDADEDFMYYFSIVWSVIVIILPWLSIILCTATTVYYLVVARKKRNEMQSENPTNAANVELHREDLAMVISITVSFLLTLAPEILFIILYITARNSVVLVSTLYIEVGTYMALAVKSAIPCFIYFVTNGQFRQAIKNYVS